ncbi:MAG: 4Fe-4S binding protein [Desulfobacteraceae bacterium]|nr:4Fe-4S binding protein [Desulfobacteraceae bacterium]
MYSRILILRFPRTQVQKPTVCNLAKEFDLTFNILQAKILPRKEGLMVLELSGTKKQFREGLRYLSDQGVDVQNASSEMERDIDKCTHCGSCTAVCPTNALHVIHPEMIVEFDQQRCSVCGLCINACPPRVINVRPTSQAFF